MKIVAVLAVLLSTGGVARAQEAAPAPVGETRPVSLVTLDIDVITGGEMQQGWGPFCTDYRRVGMARYISNVSDARLRSTFAETVRAAGFEVPGDVGSLFEGRQEQTDFQVAGRFTVLEGRMCGSMVNLDSGRGRLVTTLSVAVEWQIYSARERRVIASTPTRVELNQRSEQDEISLMFLDAYSKNVQQLVASEAFRAAFIRPANEPSAGGAGAIAGADATAIGRDPAPAETAAITISGPEGDGELLIEDVVGSVVAIIAGRGHGSGALIGAEGYIVTNAHVVGNLEEVTIRWSDGLETPGRVLRKDTGRDVALIQTRARVRQPIAMNATPPRLGADVYAVGAPIEEVFQGTVTRGIVSSSTRVYDGLAYIQSDVNVNPGNSGGPLVDAQGRLVGLTVSGIVDAGVPTGINLFIPAADVIDFLRLNIQ